MTPFLLSSNSCRRISIVAHTDWEQTRKGNLGSEVQMRKFDTIKAITVHPLAKRAPI